jgi:hypothetical protein
MRDKPKPQRTWRVVLAELSARHVISTPRTAELLDELAALLRESEGT